MSALNGGRRSQPSGESGPGQQASSLFADDRFASFEPGQRFDRNTSAQSNLQPSTAYNMFAGANQSAWNYNGGAAATMGGPMSGMNDGSRIRASSRRPVLHPVGFLLFSVQLSRLFGRYFMSNGAFQGMDHKRAAAAGQS